MVSVSWLVRWLGPRDCSFSVLFHFAWVLSALFLVGLGLALAISVSLWPFFVFWFFFGSLSDHLGLVGEIPFFQRWFDHIEFLNLERILILVHHEMNGEGIFNLVGR